MIQDEHAWPSDPDEARRLQERLAKRVVAIDNFGPIRTVAGIDAHPDPADGLMWAAVVVLSYPALEVLETRLLSRPGSFPYIPGLLSFREAPAVLDALAALRQRPDLLIVDGQGIAHPRRIGIAAHVGVLSGIPAIGAAKSRLTGTYREPGLERGDWSPLMHRGEVVGAALRTRRAVSPIFVSIGHRIGLDSAIRFTLACSPRYRVPEPTRLADRLSRQH